MDLIQSDSKKYVACATFEGTIKWYGEGGTPEEALSDFIDNGQFDDYCQCVALAPDGGSILVKVFEAIHLDSQDADDYEWEDDWSWVLGDEVSSHQVTYEE